MPETVVRSTELFFQEGTSDKVYNVQLLEVGDGLFTVSCQWGRRGANLQTGTKAVRVTREKADKAYDKVVRQKTGKGYEVRSEKNQPAAVSPPVGQGSATRSGRGGRAVVGQPAQLLNNVEEGRLDELFSSDDFIAQQKLDGMRVLVHVREEGVVATNREGQATALTAPVGEALAPAPEGTIFDGELVGSVYWVFDLIAYGDEDLRELGYVLRYERLTMLGVETDEVSVVPSAATAEEKQRLFETLKSENAEGVVFKKADAPYTPGRPASGGTQLKFKFTKTADVIVIENAGNAYKMAVYEDDELVEIGKVFAGTTSDSRSQLDRALSQGRQPVVEVKYLYATTADQLYQPVFVRFRPDKRVADCTLEQLVYTNKTALEDI